MSKRTIAKFCSFVICLATVAAFFGCDLSPAAGTASAADSPYAPPRVIGNIRSADITEASGLSASRCQSDVLWTHNDSGDDAFIFALDLHGESLGTWRVTGAKNIDWEDIATTKDAQGKCWLYIGEIGDNKAQRPEHTIYRVAEPTAKKTETPTSRENAVSTQPSESVTFSYPDFNQDAETLLVHPRTGDIYVVTKRVSGPAGVYRIKSAFSQPELQKAEKVGEISVPAIPNGLLTGGDISPDGKRLVLCDYTRAYEYELPKDAVGFDQIWKQQPVSIDIGKRQNGEAICYNVDGTAIFATSEKKNPPLIEAKRR